MKPHKHAELIKAWADGAEIQHKTPTCTNWSKCKEPSWIPTWEYRIKPAEKVVRWQWITVCDGSKPQISRSFFTEQEVSNGFQLGVKIVGKAEWSRMEFDE